ncbi:MAG: 3',5'-cyclic adenosine monophosphate phosphodiesterase CpdA [Candidatus Heimdallarchaeota archaeon AB_125]|nr:MAG: 3',5'-cyclic adenosine monophosphate phosphodiesterase CpdA [Candidatus Heimdallarchaeota archaeon AB_125]
MLPKAEHMKNRKSLQVFTLILIFMMPATVQFFQVSAKVTEIIPYQIHLSWQHDTSTTMTMSWKTSEVTESIVQYGLGSTYGSEETGLSGTLHTVELTGLTPNTVYHYRVGDGNTWSIDLDFKTGNVDEHAKFLAIGDSRTNRADRRVSSRQISKVSADFAIFDGDLVESGLDANQWNDWFYDLKDLLYEFPFMSALGNHEKNHTNYYKNFAFPGKEEYYSFNYGPVHISVLHTCVESYGGTFDEQIAWLHTDLQAHNDYPWKLILMHKPAYASSTRYNLGQYDDIITLLVPIFEQYNITMVVSGHDHFYERLMNNNITYVIAGSIGAPLYDLSPALTIPQSIISEAVYHFTLLDVYPNQLNFRAFRMDYSLIDEFTINKDDKPDLRVEVVQNKYTGYFNLTQEVNIRVTNIGTQDITEVTEASITNDTTVLHTQAIPALDVGESYVFQKIWSVSEPGTYNWTITVDDGEIIDEVVEGNNEIALFFYALEYPTTETSYSFNILMIVSFVMMLMIATVIRRKRKE